MAVATRYRWLEPKPQMRHTKQLGLRGVNMTAWHVVADIVAGGMSVDTVAADRGLPLEAVREAVEYYRENQSWIDAEVEATSRESPGE